MLKLWVPIIIVSLIISITLASSVDAQGKYSIPAWVKGIAGFWAEDKITDSDFGEGLSFLISEKIIEVPEMKSMEQEIAQLKTENKNLKGELRFLEKENAEFRAILNSEIIETGISSYLDDLESTSYECPSSHPYEWSDGLCYDQPEYYDNGCPNGYPYLWSDDQCHTISEYLDSGCPRDYPYEWSDGLCYDLPEYYYDEPVDTTPSCDPSYPDVCIAPYPPDLDCDEIFYSNFRVVGSDPHGFDRDNDGIGCEVGSPQSSAPSCDPSYPDVCIAPYPPDLNCGDIGYSNFRVIGDDPHGFDKDNDGIGCES